jgi:hypothetical protein
MIGKPSASKNTPSNSRPTASKATGKNTTNTPHREMKEFFHRALLTQAPASVILIRLMVGGLFVSEGIQKFLFASKLGAGRFEKIGIPFPEMMGPVVGGFETICGLLVLAGLATRLACVPLIVPLILRAHVNPARTV